MTGWRLPLASYPAGVSLASVFALSVCLLVTHQIDGLHAPKDIRPPARLIARHAVAGLPQPLAQFDSVFWEPRDTESLRAKILSENLVRGKSVLEIGTGTGLLAICCLRAGAERVVATDINPAAIANLRYNVALAGYEARCEMRLVPLDNPSAFSVLSPDERFDLIISNPPWEEGRPRTAAEHALYDPGFQLLQSLLAEGERHLRSNGRIWLAYGSKTALERIQSTAADYGWSQRWLDPRRWADLPLVFLPGVLVELTRANPESDGLSRARH